MRVSPGAVLPAGALNYDGLLAVRVTAASADSTPARIARMATEARVGGWRSFWLVASQVMMRALGNCTRDDAHKPYGFGCIETDSAAA